MLLLRTLSYIILPVRTGNGCPLGRQAVTTVNETGVTRPWFPVTFNRYNAMAGSSRHPSVTYAASVDQMMLNILFQTKLKVKRR